MANDFTTIMPKILAAGLLALRQQAIMPRLVNTDYGTEAALKGTAIDIPMPQAYTVANVTARPTFASANDSTPSYVQLPLDQWKHVDFFLTDKQMVEVDRNRHFMPMQVSEAVKALANNVDNYIHNLYKGVFGYVGTAGTAPFASTSDATEARRRLAEQLSPMDNLRMVINPAAESKALQLTPFSDWSQSNDARPKIEGEIGRKFGFDWYMTQNVVSHAAGTAASCTVSSTQVANTSTIDMIASGGGTINVGDIFTLSGDTQTYVIKARSANSLQIANTSTVTLTVAPVIQQAVSAATQVTFKGSHAVNLAFHRNAFAFASRPLMANTAELSMGSQMMTATDPISGIGLRLEVARQYKQVIWDFDVLFGGLLVRPEFACRVAG